MSFGQRHGAGRGAGGRTASQPSDPLVGRQLEKYILEQRIGVGGSGAVYRARHAHLNRAFAVKVLRADLLTDQESRDRFKREVEVLAELSHPNIVSLVDAGYEEGVGPYMIMEWLEGTTLFAERRNRNQFTTEEVLVLLDQLTDALSFIHRRGLIHRDLKPENIMLLQSTGEDPNDLSKRRLKIFDFGIVLNEDDDNRLTAAGMVVGTPHYMAPEQILIDADVDYRADLYAAGAILFELLAGRPPFGDQKQPLEVMKRHVSVAPPRLEEVAPHRSFSAGTQSVVMRCLEKNPAHRYQDARELFESLRQVVNPAAGPPVAIAPPVEPAPDPHAELYEATRQIESPFSVEDFQQAAAASAATESLLPTPAAPPAANSAMRASSPFLPVSNPGSPFASGPAPFSSAFPPSSPPEASAPSIPVVAATGEAPAWSGGEELSGSLEEEATRIDVTVPPNLLASLQSADSSQEQQVQEYADSLLSAGAPAPPPSPLGSTIPGGGQFAPPPPPPIPANSPLRKTPPPASLSVDDLAREAQAPPAAPAEKPRKRTARAKAEKTPEPAKKPAEAPKGKQGNGRLIVIGAVGSLLLGALAFLLLRLMQAG